jgi:hypothetical protein
MRCGSDFDPEQTFRETAALRQKRTSKPAAELRKSGYSPPAARSVRLRPKADIPTFRDDAPIGSCDQA